MLSLAARFHLSRARAAARKRDWDTAAKRYAAFLERHPGHGSAWIQLGHVRKEQGDLLAAQSAYQRAITLNPDQAETWLHLGHVLKWRHESSRAIRAFETALNLAPDLSEAMDELKAIGAGQALETAPAELEIELEMGAARYLDEVRQPEFYALEEYDAFRRQMRIASPPDLLDTTQTIDILIDARAANAPEVKSTLSSLLDQDFTAWRATIAADPALLDHPVSSLAKLDARVMFVDAAGIGPWGAECVEAVLLTAGISLARRALSWFVFAGRRTGCAAAYSDHDHSVEHWRNGRTFVRPQFQPMFDPDWFAEERDAPAIVFVDRRQIPELARNASAAGRQKAILQAGRVGGVAHIPIVLASVRTGAAAEPTAILVSTPKDTPIAREVEADPPYIQVIIQTRDQADLLRACIDSLKATASRPDRIEIWVIDNRSTEAGAARLMQQLQKQGVHVKALDEPFNWSRANNLAASLSSAPLILFLNNDTEALSPGWDELLRQTLARPDVGAVGALLLYPDRTIQHAGMIFGMGSPNPVHEGVAAPGDNSGPSRRWARDRTASAVTGAFLAMRRSTFVEAGEFDAVAFPIAYNDVDLCLRIRADGRRIVMASRIRFTHHESKTRGTEFNRERVAWDAEDLGLLHRRWGAALYMDPGYNPNWSRFGKPFGGYRFVSRRELIRHLDASAGAQPWRVSPKARDEGDIWW